MNECAKLAPRARLPRDQQGVMLIEMLVGLVIFMIGALGMMGFVGKSMGDSVEARTRAQAAFVAQEFFSRLDSSIGVAQRSGNLATYSAAINAAAPVVFNAWKSQSLDSAGAGLPNASASYTVLAADQSVHVQLTITWRIRADNSAAGLANAPVRTYVTTRPVI